MKKNRLITIGCVIVSIATVLVSIFLIKTNHVDDGNTSANIQQIKDAVKGHWRVVSCNDTICKNEEMIITDTECISVKENNTASQSAYKITDKGNLVVPELAAEYAVEIMTAEYVKLVDVSSGNTYNLLKQESEGGESIAWNPQILSGDWEILVHGGTKVFGESLTFKDGKLSLYQKNEPEPYLSKEYTYIGERVLSIADLSLEMEIIIIEKNTLGLVERNTGYVWEITKKH